MATYSTMSIEEIKTLLNSPEGVAGLLDKTITAQAVTHIIDSITVIRSDAYDQGWRDAEAEEEEDDDR